jgi:CHAT domain-containing protein
VSSLHVNQKVYLPLSENRKEVANIHQMMGGLQFLSEAATEKAFWQHAPHSRILHLAMHSSLDVENPLFSTLVFSQANEDTLDTQNDGFLHAYELYQMNLNADLIVLSACESGYGKLLQGEGMMSLARSFQYAGSKNILMSLWQVDDKSTSDLMMQFYKNLDRGLPKDEALRKAKLNLLENSPFRHPCYWAGFILSGDDLPIRHRKINRYVLAFFAIVLLIGGGYCLNKYFYFYPQ